MHPDAICLRSFVLFSRKLNLETTTMNLSAWTQLLAHLLLGSSLVVLHHFLQLHFARLTMISKSI